MNAGVVLQGPNRCGSERAGVNGASTILPPWLWSKTVEISGLFPLSSKLMRDEMRQFAFFGKKRLRYFSQPCFLSPPITQL